MDSAKISQLAQLLRESGDKVLNDKYKLTLSAQLLQALSDSFRHIVDEADELLGAGHGNGAATASASLLHSSSHSSYSHTHSGGGGGSDAGHFQVVSKFHNSRTPEMRDLQLIFDFVQKTRILCVTNFTPKPNDLGQSTVDITRFRNLRRLEIAKLSVARVRGIQKLRAHLHELKCVQALDSVEEIISHCGGDRCNGFAWNELHTVDFSYNALRSVDGSLEFVTSLQYLNLSHNQIVSVEAIKWLKNLKYLNLSFNRLPHVPVLHVEAPRRLKVLILANNHIEDMGGLSRLDALCELDMSDNYLLDHSALLPLSTLIALQRLNLTGNPMACHPKHRPTTARYLHRNTASTHFSLDNEPLSKSEKALTGSQQSVLNTRAPFFSFSRRSQSSAATSMTSSRLTTLDNTPASSVGSLHSFRLTDSMSGSLTGSVSVDPPRKIRLKTATIAAHPPDAEPQTTASANKPPPAALRLDAGTAHLETKRQIEEMRKLHGASWLQTHGAKLGHAVVGTGTGAGAADELFGSPRLALDPSRMPALQTSTPTANTSTLEAATLWESCRTPSNTAALLGQGQTNPAADISDTSAYVTALDSSDLQSDQPDEELAKSSNHIDATLVAPDMASIFPTTGGADDDDDAAAIDPPSEPEDNEIIYRVTLQPSLVDMLLIVSDANLREKDALTGRTLTKWSIATLESCDRTRTDVLRLNFDTLQRDRRERIYRSETGLCQELERYLRSILASRPLSEMNQVMWRCIKCATHFSRETSSSKAKAGGKKAGGGGGAETRCPNCGSTFLVEMHESPRSTAAATVAEFASAPPIAAAECRNVEVPTQRSQGIEVELPRVPLENCESQSSIGSAHSLNESSSCSRISKSSSFGSNRSVDGSFGAAGRSRRAADFANADQQSFVSSDVEILSNPSQSSIEVLEYNASRKHSEEQVFGDGGYATGLEAYQRSIGALSLDTVADQINRLSVDPAATTATLQHQQTSTRDLLQLVNSEPEADAPANRLPANGSPAKEQERADVAVNLTVTATVPRPTHLGQSHLTESSSSGSVTDSICTTYDQNQRTISNSNTSSIIGDVGLRSPERLPTGDTSGGGGGAGVMLTSMLGGLFQSTNNLMSRSQRNTDASSNGTTGNSPDSPLAALTKPFKFSYFDFEDVDHRLKLYLYQSVFEDDNEQLKWLVRGQMLLERPAAAKWQTGPAIFVVSTTKFYVLQITGAESDNVSKWLKRQLSGTIDRLQMVRVLPWKIGLTVSIKGIGTVQLLLQDILRTDSLLLFFANHPLPDTCQLKYQPDELLGQRLLLTTDNAPLKMLAILTDCSHCFSDASAVSNETSTPTAANPPPVSANASAIVHRLPGLIVTETRLYLLEPCARWLLPLAVSVADEISEAREPLHIDATADADQPTGLRVVHSQLMNNLVAAERLDERVVRFIYLEEMHDRQEEWQCRFETADNASSTLDAVAQSWERLFGVPLGCH